MPDLKAARTAIQAAYTRLINRFGPESDVILALEEALNHLKESQVTTTTAAPESEAAASAEGTTIAQESSAAHLPAEDSKQPTQKAEAPGSKPRKAGVRHGRR